MTLEARECSIVRNRGHYLDVGGEVPGFGTKAPPRLIQCSERTPQDVLKILGCSPHAIQTENERFRHQPGLTMKRNIDPISPSGTDPMPTPRRVLQLLEGTNIFGTGFHSSEHRPCFMDSCRNDHESWSITPDRLCHGQVIIVQLLHRRFSKRREVLGTRNSRLTFRRVLHLLMSMCGWERPRWNSPVR